MESQFRSDCNKTLMYIIVCAILFFIFVLPAIDSSNQKETKEIKEKLEDVKQDIPKIDTNKCSKQCCRQVQWPVDIGEVEGDLTQEELKNYIGSNLSCNFGQGSGCLCVSKNDFNYLGSRGGNSGSNMCGQ